MFKTISFSTHYPKLDLPIFSTIRSPTSKHQAGIIYIVKLKGAFFCNALLLHVQKLPLNHVSDDLIRFDTFQKYFRRDFINLLRQFHGQKDWWMEKNTMVQLLWFQKIEPKKSIGRSNNKSLEGLF